MVTATRELRPIKPRNWKAGKPRHARKWARTEWHERTLRERYDSNPRTVTELRQLFGIPRFVVLQWAQQLGLSRLKKRPWSEEELRYLESNLHHAAIATIADRLGRSICGVTLKAKRLRLNKTSEGYTLRQVCEGLGEDHHKVRRWVEAGALKGSRRHTLRERDIWLFTDENLQAFIRQHPMEINLRKVDQLWFMGLIITISTHDPAERMGRPRNGNVDGS